MRIEAARLILGCLAAYLAAGTVVGTAFVAFGVDRVDASARGAPWTFRLIVLPGVIALWPWAALRWIRFGARP